jgi:hypothetical protein
MKIKAQVQEYSKGSADRKIYSFEHLSKKKKKSVINCSTHIPHALRKNNNLIPKQVSRKK